MPALGAGESIHRDVYVPPVLGILPRSRGIVWILRRLQQRGSFILGPYPFYTMESKIAEAEDHYNGAAKEGKVHGDGEMRYMDGSIYIGES